MLLNIGTYSKSMLVKQLLNESREDKFMTVVMTVAASHHHLYVRTTSLVPQRALLGTARQPWLRAVRSCPGYI